MADLHGLPSNLLSRHEIPRAVRRCRGSCELTNLSRRSVTQSQGTSLIDRGMDAFSCFATAYEVGGISVQLRNFCLAAISILAVCALSGTGAEAAFTGAVVRYAVVGSDGTLVRGHGATGASRLNTGTYEVDFNVNLTRCAFEATPGSVLQGNPPHVSISTAGRAGNVRGVFVESQDFSGNFADASFHLSVLCTK